MSEPLTHPQGPRERLLRCWEAVHASPEDPELQYDLAEALLATGDLIVAEASYSRAIELGTKRVAEAWTQSAGLAAARKDLDASEERLRKALEARQDFAPAWANLGFVHLQRGQVQEAVGALTRAAELAPSPDLLTRLAMACLAAGDLDGCERAGNRAVELAPDFAPAWDTLAVAAYRRGDAAKAHELQERARSLGFSPNAELGRALAARRKN